MYGPGKVGVGLRLPRTGCAALFGHPTLQYTPSCSGLHPEGTIPTRGWSYQPQCPQVLIPEYTHTHMARSGPLQGRVHRRHTDSCL